MNRDDQLAAWQSIAGRLRPFAIAYSTHPLRNHEDKLTEVLAEYDRLANDFSRPPQTRSADDISDAVEGTTSDARPVAGDRREIPSIDEMVMALNANGWTQLHANVWESPVGGEFYRGPALAYHVMMRLPWPPRL